MIIKYIQKLRHFSILERFKLLKYTFGNILINSVSKNLIKTFELFKTLEELGYIVNKVGKMNIIHFKNQKILIANNSSDAQVFEQIFLDEEYSPILKLFLDMKIEPTFMMDAGANIGLTSLYFKAHFPHMQIITLEPAESTFNRLTQNILINNYTNVINIKKGLWGKSTKLKADRSFRDGQDWSFRLVEARPTEQTLFESTCVQDIISDYSLLKIDFLKMDIEGGEDDVFSNNSNINWLDKVAVIAIEIHDEFNCRERIESMLQKYNFELSHSGELTIGINKILVP